MQTFEYTITDAQGIHARPAGLLVKEAEKYQSNIRISTTNKECDAKRLFAVMGMGIKCGNKVTITTDGTDEISASENLKQFFEKNL